MPAFRMGKLLILGLIRQGGQGGKRAISSKWHVKHRFSGENRGKARM